MWLRVSAIIFQLFTVVVLEKCALTILELNWNQRLEQKKTKLNIYHHMLRSFTQLQNMSFHVAGRTTTSTKCQKMKNARAKRAKILFFIVKYGNLWGFFVYNKYRLLHVMSTTYFHAFFLPLANRLYQFNSKTRNLFTVEISLTPELV